MFTKIPLEDRIASLQVEFANSLPMKHVVIDRFLDEDVARKAMNSYPPYEQMERIRDSFVEKRASETRLDRVDPVYRAIFDHLRSPEFISFLEGVTGIANLSAVESMDGAGLHQIRDGGFHNIHADKNRDPIRGYFHRLSLIVYLNEGWRVGSSGALELWDRDMKNCVKKVDPLFNRCIVFEVHDRAYHGYGRLQLPPDQTRKSLAMWYLSTNRGHDQALAPRGVDFVLRPTDSLPMRVKHHARKWFWSLPRPVTDAAVRVRSSLPRHDG